MRMTKNRSLIYKALENSTMPISAMEIYDLIKAQGEEIWLSTIYRNLEAFEGKKMVIKSKIPGSDKYHYILCDGGHHHYAICLSCKKIIGDLPCPMHEYRNELDNKKFEIIDHRFIVYGYCSQCK